jgi:RNA polymerase sigma-70 factor (ECF subfamily)
MVPDPAAVARPKTAGTLTVPLGTVAGAAADDEPEREVSALFRESAAEIRTYALLLSKDEQLSQDALQEAFMRYFIALSEGQRIAHPRAWIYRVVCNYVLDRMKQLRARGERSLEDLPDSSARGEDVEATCYRNEVFRLIEKTLTPRELQCVSLRSRGLRYEEIASALHLRSGTVGALISRATRRMQAIVGQRARSTR